MDNIVFFYPEGHEAHYERGHPEQPERVEVLRQALRDAGWWEAYPQLSPQELSSELLGAIHTPAYLDLLEEACKQGAHLDMDTYTTTNSWRLALNAAGGGVAVARAVWEGRSRRGFALARPPGHHATPDRGMGFCLLNNIALAAEFLIRGHLDKASNAERLAIVDLDLHHGNGTQDAFWSRGDVLYISTHQYPHYPGTGSMNERGAGSGEDCTANFPFPPLTGDQGFQVTMEECILPLLDRFSPQMLLISFGFDPHWRDPLGQLMLTAGCYGELVAQLAGWADRNCEGKIALFLEGGYDLEAGAACAQAVVAALLGQSWQDPLGPSPRPEGDAWRMIVRAAKEVWRI